MTGLNFLNPINLNHWIETHRELLKPPIGNKVIWRDGDFICMVVGGPNQRTDYHYEEGPEFFYQLEGEMVLKVIEGDQPRDIRIGAGEVFLLPPRVPHSPQRMPESVGLVIERQRLDHELDGLMWFCERCHHRLYEEYFHLQDIETQFDQVFNNFYPSVHRRTCQRCNHLNPAPAHYLSA